MPDSNQRISHSIAASVTSQDAESLAVSVAQQIILDHASPIHDTTVLPLKQALGRVLAVDVISPINVPAHDNSAMDGYALRSADLASAEPVTLKVAGRALAGHAYAGQVHAGECVRIMTGAVIPKGCDCVLPQEAVLSATDAEAVLPAASAKAGDNLRRAGEDLALGQIALPQGRLLTPADIGLLASLGMAEVAVFRKLRVAYFSTGDELRSVGQPLDEGSVYDSNRYTLHGMLMRLGCEPVDMGVIRDDPASIEAALRDGCQQADAVITSGGVSAGDADHTRRMMDKLGDVAFWKLAMRPGRPLAFGKLDIGGKCAPLFGLPGNPVAVMVSFYFFVRPALLRMMGAAPAALPVIRARSLNDIRKKSGRTEYQRGIASTDSDGQLSVRVTGAQGSGILSSMSEANCMIILSDSQTSIQTGDRVNVLMFDGLI